MGSVGVASRIRGRGALLRSLRALVRRVDRFGIHRAATPTELGWALKLADALERALADANDGDDVRASLAAADARARVSRKSPPGAMC